MGRSRPFAAQVEDDRGDCVPLTLYNALAPDVSLREAQAHFPKGTRLAVKEPYLKLSNAGTLTAVWIPTTGFGGPHQSEELSSSVKSTSIRLIFGRIACSRRVLGAQRKGPNRSITLTLKSG